MRAKDHPLYVTWASMLNRTSKTHKKKCYEGVTVYEPWTQRFKPRRVGPSPGLLAFADYVENNLGPQLGRTLDRIDPLKGYEPGNIRWATASEQSHNRSPGWTKPTMTPQGRLPWAHPHAKGWLARFRLFNQDYRVGVFSTQEEAHQASAQKRAELLNAHALR